jgi:hypothetical protein
VHGFSGKLEPPSPKKKMPRILKRGLLQRDLLVLRYWFATIAEPCGKSSSIRDLTGKAVSGIRKRNARLHLSFGKPAVG